MPRHVCFLVYPGFVLMDLGGPLEALSTAGDMSGGGYRFSVVSMAGGMVRGSSGLEIATTALAFEPMDTFIVVGAPRPPDGAWLKGMAPTIARASGLARRTASVCTGAFLLAAAGILDGRIATTHWHYAPKLQARYPALRVDGDRIFTRDGPVWTSAGMSAGIDMALALIEEDLGAAIAQAVARMLVVYYRRPGGQYQFSSLLEFDPGSDRIRRTLSYAREHLATDLSVTRLAEVASLSVRQFGRAFAASTGMTPAKAIERLRVEAARPMVEDGRRSFDEIARLTGFGDPERMCQGFLRVVGHTPLELRRLARQGAAVSERQIA
ncbi:GlxA family transcriptional regulator [Rhodovastum atsumiense]|uniref:GlxA family transcriptional regulator n=1 Tax=Rhodovastum atsumiense TaxID=504468 RepID=A0A5M6IPS9_9PROT|nr:GlxA family transcriptional regulator [Rhodovastum atsumiense]KAA5610290.1 GlxA family transcriptional regulator [Rhodovastum atsumiense]CAH2602223.1 GlxA family transcriptional regulator [Rhodovastum atsumiense]